MDKEIVLKILQDGPKDCWSRTPEEMEALKLSEQYLLEATESLKYRKQLLEAFTEYHRAESADNEAQNSMGEDL